MFYIKRIMPLMRLNLQGRKLPLLILIIFVIAAIAFRGGFRSNQKPLQTSKQPLRLVIAEPTQPGAGLIYVAIAKGCFRDEGIEAALQSHSSGKSSLEAVVEGKADLAVSSETPIMFAVMRREKLVVVATIFTSDKSVAIIARKDRGISDLADLKNKRIGTAKGTNGAFFLDAFLTFHGISLNEIKVVDLKPEEIVNSLKRGEVDAVSIWHPGLLQLQQTLGERGITFYGEELYTFTLNITATKDFVEKNPETIIKVLRALVKAELFVRSHPNEAHKIIAYHIKMDEGLLAGIWDGYNFAIGLRQSLIANLEDRTRWANEHELATAGTRPNYLDHIYFEGMEAVKPEGIGIIR